MESNNPFIQEANENVSRLVTNEEMLGKGLCQPFVDCNSGVRKLMFSIHIEQSLPLINPEVPYVMTGYEQGFGDRSSSIIKADAEYEVVAKISKFKDSPQQHYFLILRNLSNNQLSYVERQEYIYSTETYGYAYDTRTLDALEVGFEISDGDILRKSTAYDDYMNPANCVNLLATYIASDITTEDSIWISKSAQKKLSSYLYKVVVVNVNDNDILLNLMGDDNNYVSFPIIERNVQNGILCAVRREKIEESLFTQSVEMLQTILMSDDKYTPGDGVVVDIDIMCNNPENIREKYSNSQVLYIYEDHLRFISEFVNTVENLMVKYNQSPQTLEYQLGKMYYNFKQELSGTQFREQKVYSGTEIRFIIRETNIPSKGDKLATRYGGKGVIAKICEDEEMPKISLTNESLEMIVNSSTCVNRENVGQWDEISLTHVGKCIIDLARIGYWDTAETLQEYVKYVSFCSPFQGQEIATYLSSIDEETRDVYVQSLIDDGNIMLSIKPISESMSLDMISDLYDAFPYITQRALLSPIVSSTGETRFVPARRQGVVGHIAMYRLQQYAQEKHSVTALSATNLRNENSRNKANKYYKAIHQATPVNFGDMESGDLGHAGFENVITILMIHSVSPHARRLVEQMFTEDPYLVDIKLDENSSNRSAEILNAYLKAIGYRLVFEKIKKEKIHPLLIRPFTHITYDHSGLVKPFFFLNEKQVLSDPKAYMEWLQGLYEKIEKKPFFIRPFISEDEKVPVPYDE